MVLRTGAVGIVAAVAMLAAGIAYARFTAPGQTQTNTFSAGTVTLTTNATSTCTVSGLLPGQSPAPCTLKATYSGSVSGWVALDVLIATKSQSPGSIALYNPSDSSNDLQITIKDDQSTSVTYVTPSTSFGSALGSCPTGSGFGSSFTCYQLTDLLVNSTALTSASSPVTFKTSVTLPSSNGSGYQGGTASIVLTAHATQSSHNGSTVGCTPGQRCDNTVPGTGPHWS